MTHKIRFAARGPAPEAGAWIRGFKTVITLGIWTLVGLAGLTVWARLAA